MSPERSGMQIRGVQLIVDMKKRKRRLCEYKSAIIVFRFSVLQKSVLCYHHMAIFPNPFSAGALIYLKRVATLPCLR